MCVSGIECSIPQVACLKPIGGKRIVEGGWPPKKSVTPMNLENFIMIIVYLGFYTNIQ